MKSMRLTPEAQLLLKQLKQKLGVSEAAVTEMAIRKLAETEKVVTQK